VGDFILALPTLSALRESLQPTCTEIMAQPWNLPLVDGRFCADQVSDVNRADMAPFFQEEAALPKSMSCHLRTFDAALVFGRSQILARNLRRAGIQHVYLLPPFPRGRIHLTDHHLSSVASLGIPTHPAAPTIYLKNEDMNWAEAFLRNMRCDPDSGRGILALHPGAGSRKKAWPAHRFAAVARMLTRDDMQSLIIEGPADEQLVLDTLRDLNGLEPVILRHLSLVQLGAILKHCSLYIGNDSGVSHLAAAVGIPTIAIFGPTDPVVWAPRGERASWLRGKVSCSPCNLARRQQCTRQRCLEATTVEDLIPLLAEIQISHEPIVVSGGCTTSSWTSCHIGINHSETCIMH